MAKLVYLILAFVVWLTWLSPVALAEEPIDVVPQVMITRLETAEGTRHQITPIPLSIARLSVVNSPQPSRFSRSKSRERRDMNGQRKAQALLDDFPKPKPPAV